MKRCGQCRWKYPAHMLHDFNSSLGTIEDCCGICALVQSNKFHSKVSPRLCFDAPIAEDMRLRACKWRLGNPQCRPEGVVNDSH